MTTPTSLSPELIADMQRVGDPQLSATGLVAYTVAPASKGKDGQRSALWIVPVNPEDGEARQFSVGTCNDRHPRWSPDGRMLAFLSDREDRETAHIHLMQAHGGEARALTEGKKGVAGFVWSPDGNSIAFTSPDELDDEDRRREEEKEDARVWGERWEYGRLRVVDVATGEVRTLVEGNRHVDEIAWTPDGKRVVCVVRPTPDLDAKIAGPGDLMDVGLCDDRERILCHFTGAVDTPTVTPDGRWVLYTSSVSGRPQSSSSLWRVPIKGGQPERIAGGDTECVPAIFASSIEKLPACMVLSGLGTRVALVDPDSGQLETMYEAGDGDFLAFSYRDTGETPVLALALARPDHPTEIYAGSPANPIKRTEHHPEFNGITLGPQEDFRWTAKDGLELDGILIKPPGRRTDGPLPTIVLVHGGPYWRWGRGCHVGWADWGQWLAAQGYAIVMPNPRGGMGRGEAFAAAAVADVGGADWGDVMAAVDAAVERGIADPDRLGIGGWSQGGFMTGWAITQTDRFKAAVDGAGPSDWGWMAAESDAGTFEGVLGGSVPWDGVGPHRHNEISPLSYARNATTPTLILHGEKDERVPLSQATAFHRALRDAGAVAEFVVYPREPHGIGERMHQIDVLQRVKGWFTRYV